MFNQRQQLRNEVTKLKKFACNIDKWTKTISVESLLLVNKIFERVP